FPPAEPERADECRQGFPGVSIERADGIDVRGSIVVLHGERDRENLASMVIPGGKEGVNELRLPLVRAAICRAGGIACFDDADGAVGIERGQCVEIVRDGRWIAYLQVVHWKVRR